MAEQDPNPGAPPPFDEIAQSAARQFFSLGNLSRIGAMGTNFVTEALEISIAFVLKSMGAIGVYIAQSLAEAEDRSEPAFGRLAAVAVKDLFGVDVSEGALTGRGNRNARKETSQRIGAAVLGAITGTAGSASGGQLQPGTRAAEDYLSFVVQMGLEGWLEGWIVEAMSLGQLERFGDLDDIMAQVLGLGRISSRIVRPMLETLVITPMRWQIDKAYRPNLLSTSSAARQFCRGRFTRDQVLDELGRQGWSDDRIEALINENTKFMSDTDVAHLYLQNTFDLPSAVAYLRNLGYSEETAHALLNVEQSKRWATVERRLAAQAVEAYARREIDRGDLERILRLRIKDDTERELVLEEAEFERAFSGKRISESDLVRAVKSGLANIRDYRDLLRELGYDEQSILWKELLLQTEIETLRDAAEAKRQKEAEAAAEKAQREAEAEQRRLELEAKRARTLPSLAQVERAVITGILPIARYDAQLEAEKYSDEDRAFLVALVEDKRQQYLEQQKKRAEAEARAEQQAIPIAALERAVLEGILGLAEYRASLRSRGFASADADLLVALLEAKLADRRAAEARRLELERDAATRGLSLSELARAVRRGIVPIDDYRRAAEDQGFAPSDVAILVALLADELERDADARRERERAEAEANTRGVSLEVIARAVRRGVRTMDDYREALIDARLAPEAQQVLIDLLSVELAEADAARALREADPTPAAGPTLPLSTIEAAVKMGVLPFVAYGAELSNRGYSDRDRALLEELLLVELQDLAIKRARRDELEREDAARRASEIANAADELPDDAGTQPARALSLAQFGRAVKAGLRTLEDYFVFVAGLGFSAEDADLLTSLLDEEMAAKATSGG